MSNTEALRARLLEHAAIHDDVTAPHSDEQAQWAADLREAAAMLAQQPAASGEPAEPLKGWKLNHAQKGPHDGMAEIGYLDPEDDRFSPIVRVDTGLYYQADQAMPLAVAILGALADAAPQPAPALVPLTLDQISEMTWGAASIGMAWDTRVSMVRDVERAHGIPAAVMG